MTNELKIVTCNARGLGDDKKHRTMFRHFHVKKFDMIFLQETHSEAKLERRWSVEWGNHIYFSHGNSNSKGVAILFNKNSPFQLHNVDTDKEGRYLLLYGSLGNKKYLLVNFYAPNDDNTSSIDCLVKRIEKFSPDYIIWGGDFNLVMDQMIDGQGRKANHDKIRGKILTCMNNADLIDI